MKSCQDVDADAFVAEQRCEAVIHRHEQAVAPQLAGEASAARGATQHAAAFRSAAVLRRFGGIATAPRCPISQRLRWLTLCYESPTALR